MQEDVNKTSLILPRSSPSFASQYKTMKGGGGVEVLIETVQVLNSTQVRREWVRGDFLYEKRMEKYGSV